MWMKISGVGSISIEHGALAPTIFRIETGGVNMFRGAGKYWRNLSLLLAGIMFAAMLYAAPGVNTARAALSPADSAVEFLHDMYTANGLENSDGGIGSYSLYLLDQAGVNISAWEYGGISFEDAVISAINDDLSNPDASAKLLAQDLAAAQALGEYGLAEDLLQELQDRDSSSGFDNNPYSDIPAYDLLGRLGELSVADEVYAKDYILAAQNTSVSDAAYGSFGGGWGPDFMITAQAVRALYGLDSGDSEVQAAIDMALDWMEDQQQDDGSFTIEAWGYWDDPVIDTAETIVALDLLGMDIEIWDSGGYTAVDYMLDGALNDDGSFGMYSNSMDANWALSAYNLMEITFSPSDYAIEFLQNDYTANGLNNADGGVGAYALYVLDQAGVDTGGWDYGGTNLDNAVIGEINDDITAPSGLSAKLLAQDLLASKALGEEDLADELAAVLLGRESSAGFDGNPYVDIPAYDLIGRAGSISALNAGYAKECILAAQNTMPGDINYGSFGSVWGTDFYPDFMTTAQAVRALQYLDPDSSDAEIQAAIDAALAWLEDMQQDDGSFSGSEWDDPVIDTAEVILTLAALGLDPADWESGSGNTAVDYMTNDALNDDGSFGTSKNVMDATWALCAYNLMDTQFYLSPASASLGIGGTKQFEAVWQGADGTDYVTEDAQWSAADNTVASVDSSGLVTALKEGETKVYAVYGGLTAAANVTVSASTGGIVSNSVTAYLAVVGTDNDLLYGPSRVSVDESNEWGLTALGALDASGVSYETSSWSYGYLVDSIEGLANSGMSGWMYTVNDMSPGVGADQYEIKDDDEIIFYYSESMDQEPPSWEDLKVISAGGGAGASAGLPDPVSDSDLNSALRHADAAGQVILEADDEDTALVLSIDQVNDILDTGLPLAVTIQGVQIILSPESLEVEELLAEETALLVFEVEKLSSDEAQELAEPSAAVLMLAGEVYDIRVRVADEDGRLQDIEQFPGCKLLLPVPAGMEETAAAGMLKACLYNEESGLWDDMNGAYGITGNTIGFDVVHFSRYALLETIPAPVEKITFLDIAGHWAQEEIELMAAQGYVTGIGENLFAPEAIITRAEFAAILSRMAGLEDNAGAAAHFSDVPAGAWFQGTVGAAATAGLVYGISENSFAPGEPVTREQMAAMIVRYMSGNGMDMAAGAGGIDGLVTGFSDSADISPWAASPVAQAIKSGLMLGREEGLFVPLGSATRAEATVVLCRALQMIPQP
jgi:prenyltransferase beta subunit